MTKVLADGRKLLCPENTK